MTRGYDSCGWHTCPIIQCFFHHELQGTTGLACSGRAHEQEVILCLLGTEDDVVKHIVIVSGECERAIAEWLTLT